MVALSQDNATTLDSNVHHAQAPCGSSSLWPDTPGVMAHAAQAVQEARPEAYNHAADVAAPYHWFVPLIAYLDNTRTNSWTYRTDLAAPAPLAQEHVTTFTHEEVSQSTASTSHGLFNEPYNLGKICSVFRRVSSDDMSFRCLVSECHGSYSRWPDFLRHYYGAHAVEKKAFWCPKDGCARNRAGGNNPFPRKDKLKDHLRHAHGTRPSS